MQNKTQRHGGTEKTVFYNEELTDKIIADAIEVHRNLGPDLLEPVCKQNHGGTETQSLETIF